MSNTTAPKVNSHRGFTLTELLIVLGIILLLAGFLFPVAGLAKRSAHRAACVSNLHQFTAALLIYAESYDGLASMPSYAVAKDLLVDAPTCDAEDSFRTSCQAPTQAPLIGSYAYIRGVEGYDTQADWVNIVGINPAPYLFACTFYGILPERPFGGNDLDPCIVNRGCVMPSVLLRSLPDGSVQTKKLTVPPLQGPAIFPLFSWEEVFIIP